ncbi:MAG: 4Fe-4S binding protein [Candidatus Bathyarchaeia archaeon]
MSERKLGWKEIPHGVASWKSAEENETGSWRTLKPVISNKKCTVCLLCWVFCPDGAIKLKEGGVVVNYEFCKGCGICAKECAPRAIEMIPE